METNNRTLEAQKVIDTVHAYVRGVLLDLNEAGTALDAAKETDSLMEQIDAFDAYIKALDKYSTITKFALDIVYALGDGFEEYNAALGRGIEEVE